MNLIQQIDIIMTMASVQQKMDTHKLIQAKTHINIVLEGVCRN